MGSQADPQDIVPATPVLDGRRLVQIRVALRTGDQLLNSKLARLRAQAERWLLSGPWSVTAQKMLPPSGDIHDYASQAPYWWASPDSRDHYVRRDGEFNPEALKYTAKGDAKRMMAAAPLLSLSWFYTGDERFARHAGDILRTWFVDPATRMNPHLQHAQIIPGQNTGRQIGIIDFSQGYTSVLDAAAILDSGAPGWTDCDAQGFKQWNIDFLGWLMNSEFGIAESREANNHGTFAAMQKAAIALFVGNIALASRELNEVKTLIDRQIFSDGAQRHELDRTRSWHYSTFNLIAFCRAANVGEKLGMDLWAHTGPDGQSLRGAVRFLLAAATGKEPWSYPELDFKAFAAYDIVNTAAEAGFGEATKALESLQQPPGGSLYELRPAPEQLDAVAAG